METDTEKKQIAKKSIFSLDSDDELDDNSKCEEQPPATVETVHDNVAAVGSEKNEEKLSSFQKAKIERSRQKALLLRQARLQAHPYKRYFNRTTIPNIKTKFTLFTFLKFSTVLMTRNILL